jgi:hypothetical protein
MIERIVVAAWRVAAVVVGITAAATALWHPRIAGGIVAGGAWNLISLWCLSRMLLAWLGPSPSVRRAVLWVTLKSGLYAFAFCLLRQPAVSSVGFGIGFSLVLITMLGGLAINAQRLVPARHGR